MHIDHVALWTTDLDRCTRFYAHYLGITVGQKFGNAANGFESQFLTLESGARIEVMTTTALSPIRLESGAERMGYTHIAIVITGTNVHTHLRNRTAVGSLRATFGIPTHRFAGVRAVVDGRGTATPRQRSQLVLPPFGNQFVGMRS